MGEVADMMIDGTLCESCGDFLDGESPGYPRKCNSCGGESSGKPKKAGKRRGRRSKKQTPKQDT